MNISITTYEAIVTRKGQITLPAEVRRKLGLHRADRVQVSVRGDTVQLRRQPTSRLEVNFGVAQGRRTRLTPRQERQAFLHTVTDNAGREGATSDEQKAAAMLALLRRIQAGTEQVTTSPRSSSMVFMIEGLEKPIPIEDLHYPF